MKLYAIPWGDYNTLGIDFALEEGANPTDAFWMGSQFADEDWRNKHLGQPDVKRTGLNTNVNLKEFLRSDGIAKMKEKEKQVEMAEAKSAVRGPWALSSEPSQMRKTRLATSRRRTPSRQNSTPWAP